MLLSKLLGERYKEKPADAVLDSHIFLLRGGYIRPVSNGIFSLLTPARRITQKIEKIIREEMDSIGGQEVLFPVVLPAELWQESGRYDSVGSELLRLRDRTGRDMLLGMTHEEAAVHLARSEAKSHMKYPFMIYQIQTKFRDEPRARGGLIRVREFTMKDAYSFHTSEADLEEYYEEALQAYHRIFARVGLTHVIAVKSDTGMMGGRTAHEFMVLSDAGEDSLILCDSCGYQANMEVGVSSAEKAPRPEKEIEEVLTPGVKTIEGLSSFLGITPDGTTKAAVFSRCDNGRPVVVFLRGDRTVNETKLRKLTGADIQPFTSGEDAGFSFGYIGPYGLAAGDAQVFYDLSLQGETNLVCGANKDNYHLKNVSVPRDLNITDFYDVSKACDGDACTVCGAPLAIRRGIEVGNIFQLGTQYTKSMNMTYTDENGALYHPLMGCYGIGVGRLLACILENSHDAYGPVWPKAVAPWQLHICMLNSAKPHIREAGFSLYRELSKKYEVVLDDRDATAGVQFADADLLGIPLRLIVSPRNLDGGMVELVSRDKSIRETVSVDDAASAARRLLENIR
ncbi:MAG: proline--tRNA ligase [Clostridiales bacterium]|nr:proline--tRNA ligase [Clostridiales bacterium]